MKERKFWGCMSALKSSCNYSMSAGMPWQVVIRKEFWLFLFVLIKVWLLKKIVLSVFLTLSTKFPSYKNKKKIGLWYVSFEILKRENYYLLRWIANEILDCWSKRMQQLWSVVSSTKYCKLKFEWQLNTYCNWTSK